MGIKLRFWSTKGSSLETIRVEVVPTEGDHLRMTLRDCKGQSLAVVDTCGNEDFDDSEVTEVIPLQGHHCKVSGHADTIASCLSIDIAFGFWLWKKTATATFTLYLAKRNIEMHTYGNGGSWSQQYAV